MSVLIVLFGQENEADGKLRAPAAARCEKAAELWKELSPGAEVVVLPTGAFGQHFNLTNEPHFHYLTRELVRLGVPPENILPGVASSNTVQDSTEAWYRFRSGGYDRLVAVTSDYHAARVAFVLGRLSAKGDVTVEIVRAATPAAYAGRDKTLEPAKLEALKREWVDVIPRNSKAAPERFAAVYEEAAGEHRYYGTLSLAVVSALLIIDGFALGRVPGMGGWLLFWVLLGLALVNLLLWSIYNRMADRERTARYVLTRMEIEHRLPGVSSNRRTENVNWYEAPPWRWSMKDLLTALAIVMFGIVVIAALVGTGEPQREAVRSRSGSALPGANVSNVAASPGGNGNALDRWANAMTNSAGNTNTGRRR